MAISSGSKTPTKTPTQTFLPGQGAILTPDPTLGGAWTHTRADVPLFKNAAVTPAPGTGTGTGTGTGGTGTGGSSNPKVIDYYRDGSRRVDGVLQPRGGTWDGERGGSYFPGHTGGGSGSAWTGDGPGEQSYFPSSGSRNQAGGSDWQSRQNGSATPAAPPNYSYYGVPPSTPAAAPATPPSTSQSGGQASNPLFQWWKDQLQQWSGGQSSNPAFVSWKELLARALERD